MTSGLKISFSELTGAVGGRVLFDSGIESFDTVLTDSRKADPAYRNIFIPVIGEKFDAHDFIEDLCRNSAISVFLTSRESDAEIAKKYGISAVFTANTLYALGSIAAWYRNKFTPHCIGITGTNGKTTTKELISCIFSSVYNTHRNEKNYNNEIGVPFALFTLNSGHEYSVIEMGMNHPGEIERLSRMVRPEFSLITNAGEGHLEFLKTVENVALAKSEIFSGMGNGGTVLLNTDNEFFGLMKKEAEQRGLKVLSFGVRNGADFKPSLYDLAENEVSMYLNEFEYSVKLYGFHNLYNLLAAVSVSLFYGIKPESISNALAGFKNADNRSQIISNDFIIINDTYNSNPLSLESALVSISHIYNSRRKIAVLSDMKELGDESYNYHLAAGRQVFDNNFSILYTWGDGAAAISKGAVLAGMNENCVKHFTSRQDLINEVKRVLNKDDVVLVKGSRSMKMEEVTDSLVR
ncbi:MAG: UDP-N-acetylmuramoyl-tripeptide--D-alanyl-D-alanine ligase [Spirochaetes bacterium]|nr:UDP-N-acetylmuramoyl-tripeptide--D-alanyl-D-alanine ligase [Spirochaetota bacterium]